MRRKSQKITSKSLKTPQKYQTKYDLAQDNQGRKRNYGRTERYFGESKIMGSWLEAMGLGVGLTGIEKN